METRKARGFESLGLKTYPIPKKFASNGYTD